MKTPFRLLVLGIVGAGVMLPSVCEAASPPLADFGYGNMTTKRAIPTTIILVNFTNASTTVATPFKMGGTLVGTDYRSAEQYYSNWCFSRTTSPQSVNGYFHEISNGRFQWTPAPVCMVTVPTNVLYRVFWDLYQGTNGGAADRAYFSEMIGRAMDQGLDLMRYDLPSSGGDGNGELTPRECTIQLLINDKTLPGGGARGWNGITGRVVYAGDVTFQEFQKGLRVVEEELVHVLQAGLCGDVYGPSGMSADFTGMSGGEVVHLDAWHKLHLAWCEPRIHSLRQAGQFTLPAAQLMETNGPVIIHDPVRGTNEFFVLEYRTTNALSAGGGYDANVKDSGLVIWHAQQNSGGDVVNFTSTYFPSAQTDWRRCTNCRSLFVTSRTNWPCSQGTNVSHLAENAGEDKLIQLDPTVGGVSGWHGCNKCGQLFYLPNIFSSVCPAGDHHASGGNAVNLRHNDDPEALGTRGWERCTQCQTLFRPRVFEDKTLDYGNCAAGGTHTNAVGEVPYTLLWNGGVKTIMTEGSPNLWRSRGDAWHSGDITPTLRWFDGTRSATRISIRLFQPGADRITIDIVPEADTWVDFPYGGAEDGSFDYPFNTFAEGVSGVAAHGILHIKAGNSSETRHVTKPMRIESYGGQVKIGRQ